MLPIIIIIGALVYYQFDDALHPEVAEILNTSPVPVPVVQNAYYALLGLFAEENIDPHAKGMSVYQKATEMQTDNINSEIVFVDEIAGDQAVLPKIDDQFTCLNASAVDCIDEIERQKNLFIRLIEKNALLIERMRSLYDYRYYQETQSCITITFSNLKNLHRLVLLDISVRWLSKSEKTALKLLRDDIQFWKKVASSDVSLITHMMAVALIRQDLFLASDFISECYKCKDYEKIFEEILKPIKPQELDMTKSLYHEFRFVCSSLTYLASERELSIWEKIILQFFWKENSILNKMYTSYENGITLSKCGLDKYILCYESHFGSLDENTDFLSAEFFNDPVGFVLLKIVQPSFHGYIWRSHKLELTRRLVKIKFLLKSKNINKVEFSNYITTLPQELDNPFASKKIVFDKNNNKLILQVPEILDETSVSISL